jgi:hypothetical protein
MEKASRERKNPRGNGLLGHRDRLPAANDNLKWRIDVCDLGSLDILTLKRLYLRCLFDAISHRDIVLAQRASTIAPAMVAPRRTNEP